jgi:hypothetical protein
MTNLAGRFGIFKRLWRDDGGAVLATEWLLVTTVLVLGLVPGLIAIRQGLLGELSDVSNATSGLDQSYGFTGQEAGEVDDDADFDGDRVDAGRPRSGGNRWRSRARGANNDGGVYDPVLEAAAEVTTLDVGRNRDDRVRSADFGGDGGRNTGGRRLQAFTAGGGFIEGRHLDGNSRRLGIGSAPGRAIGDDGKPCD